MKAPIRILIAADHPAVRSEVRTILQLADGIEVIGEADSPADAARQAQALQPDVTLVDLEMTAEGGDKFAALAQIKTAHRSGALAALTVSDTPEAAESAARHGADALILKGVEFNAMIHTIRSIVRGNPMIDTIPSPTRIVPPALQGGIEAEAVQPARKNRMAYIDNLRLVMIIFVVMIHSAVTYSGLGSWYYNESANLGLVSTLLFGFFMSFTQAYFMGILFLAAGYFIPAAYDRKGPKRFIIDRIVRLGIPSLIYMLVIHPFNLYFLLGLNWVTPKPSFLAYYSGYITSLDFLSGSGPLWFALALLIFSGVYALVRMAGKREVPGQVEKKVSSRGALLLIGVIALCAFLIRIVQPIGTSVANMQLCYFASYIALFVVGILAYRHDWLKKTPASFGMNWLRAGLILSPILWLALLVGGDAMNKGIDSFNGGLHWQSLGYATWESFTAVALSIGLLTLFRERLNSQSRLVKVLSDNSFAVYVFHAPVLIGISLLLVPLAWNPGIKFLVVGLLAVTATFGLTFGVLRRVPLLKKVL